MAQPSGQWVWVNGHYIDFLGQHIFVPEGQERPYLEEVKLYLSLTHARCQRVISLLERIIDGNVPQQTGAVYFPPDEQEEYFEEEPAHEPPAEEPQEEAPTEEHQEEDAPVEEPQEEAPAEEPQEDAPAEEPQEEPPAEEPPEEPPAEQPQPPAEEPQEEPLAEEPPEAPPTAEPAEEFLEKPVEKSSSQEEEEEEEESTKDPSIATTEEDEDEMFMEIEREERSKPVVKKHAGRVVVHVGPGVQEDEDDEENQRKMVPVKPKKKKKKRAKQSVPSKKSKDDDESWFKQKKLKVPVDIHTQLFFLHNIICFMWGQLIYRCISDMSSRLKKGNSERIYLRCQFGFLQRKFNNILFGRYNAADLINTSEPYKVLDKVQIQVTSKQEFRSNVIDTAVGMIDEALEYSDIPAKDTSENRFWYCINTVTEKRITWILKEYYKVMDRFIDLYNTPSEIEDQLNLLLKQRPKQKELDKYLLTALITNRAALFYKGTSEVVPP
jgi:chemotaxis protein histidine kinase CheA